MPQKTLGHTELEWVCKRCQTKNPGLSKSCSSCGAVMDTNDQFVLPEQQKLISEETAIEATAKGADVHCPYCGARNQAGSEVCAQCNGDLKQAQVREAGKVLGAYQDQPVPEIACPFCAEKVKSGSARCPNCGGDLINPKPVEPAVSRQKMPVWLMVVLALVVVACLGSVIYFFVKINQSTDLRAQVSDVNWQRVVLIQELQPVSREAWEEDVPEEANEVSCSDRYRETSQEQAPKSTEVCGTPYTIDEGSGVGKVVQDCVYEVYDSYCKFTVEDWIEVDRAISEGTKLEPVWPEFTLEQGQRQGDRSEIFVVLFTAGDKIIEYNPTSLEEFVRFQTGSEWTLTLNGLGAITGVEP